MDVKKAHCFFEQSGTFKNEFIKLGIPAEDYDIQNNFGETDHIIDLFKEIDDAYDGKSGTVFDNVGGGDIIIAFYPCIYFCAMSQMAFSLGYTNYRKMTVRQKVEAILKRREASCVTSFTVEWSGSLAFALKEESAWSWKIPGANRHTSRQT